MALAGRGGAPTSGHEAARQLVELFQRVAPSNAIVTLMGESCTGKELVARALHKASLRARQPFVPEDP
jgi:two-component system, NtrC family, response regulator HydG